MERDLAGALRSAIAEARDRGASSEEVARLTRRFMAAHCPVHRAYEQGGVHGLREAIEAGGDPDEPDLLGMPILCVVAGAGDVAAIEYLARAGADLGGSGDAPLVHAANAGETAAVKCLLALGADPTSTHREGYTAAQRVPRGRPELYELLVAAVDRSRTKG